MIAQRPSRIWLTGPKPSSSRLCLSSPRSDEVWITCEVCQPPATLNRSSLVTSSCAASGRHRVVEFFAGLRGCSAWSCHATVGSSGLQTLEVNARSHLWTSLLRGSLRGSESSRSFNYNEFMITVQLEMQ